MEEEHARNELNQKTQHCEFDTVEYSNLNALNSQCNTSRGFEHFSMLRKKNHQSLLRS